MKLQTYEAQITLNGQLYDAQTGELPFYPGKEHQIAVKPRWILDRTDDILLIVLTKRLPDGSCSSEEAVLPADREEAVFAIGPLLAPAVYRHAAGVVYRKGYGLEINIQDRATGKSYFHWALQQGLARENCERFIAGSQRWNVYNSGYDGGQGWDPIGHSSVPMNPVLMLCLSPKVLVDQDNLDILYLLRDDASVESISCLLQALDSRGREIFSTDLVTRCGKHWESFRLDPQGWAPGDYLIRLCPVLGGKVWTEGPCVLYRRKPAAPDDVVISPFAPWRLQRDRQRSAVIVTDFGEAIARWGDPDGLPGSWRLEGQALISTGQGDQPLVFRPGLQGYYAVFAKAREGCYIQVGEDGPVRYVLNEDSVKGNVIKQDLLKVWPYAPIPLSGYLPVFVAASDLTGGPVWIYPVNREGMGLEEIHFIPVTPQSVKTFYLQAGYPEKPVFGVNDWNNYFYGSAKTRLGKEQIRTLIELHAELGVRDIQWSVGRSWVEYKSQLDHATPFPCVPMEEALKTFPQATGYKNWIQIMQDYDPLDEAVKARKNIRDIRIWGWLSMQRHYSATMFGGMFASRWYKENVQWHEWEKHGDTPGHDISFFFSEVRQERIDILLEVAKRGVDGLVICCVRQVPMLRYHPEMVRTYQEMTGIDPCEIDYSNAPAYERWIQWRADHFTQLLRDLKTQLEPVRLQLGKNIPIAVRVPSNGFLYNLAQGLDIEAWMREGLIDQLQLHPLETTGGRGSQDVKPYQEMGRHYGIPVAGGMGIWVSWNWTPGALVAAMERALGLLQDGVDGMDVFETDAQCHCDHYRWILPLFGDRDRLEDFLHTSNLKACFPIVASTAAYGHDNHSFAFWGAKKHQWNIFEGENMCL